MWSLSFLSVACFIRLPSSRFWCACLFLCAVLCALGMPMSSAFRPSSVVLVELKTSHGCVCVKGERRELILPVIGKVLGRDFSLRNSLFQGCRKVQRIHTFCDLAAEGACVLRASSQSSPAMLASKISESNPASPMAVECKPLGLRDACPRTCNVDRAPSIGHCL